MPPSQKAGAWIQMSLAPLMVGNRVAAAAICVIEGDWIRIERVGGGKGKALTAGHPPEGQPGLANGS